MNLWVAIVGRYVLAAVVTMVFKRSNSYDGLENKYKNDIKTFEDLKVLAGVPYIY